MKTIIEIVYDYSGKVVDTVVHNLTEPDQRIEFSESSCSKYRDLEHTHSRQI